MKGGLEGEAIALVFAPSAEMIGWCLGGGGETGGREGLLASLVALTEVEGVGLLPGRDKLLGCAGETPSGAGLSGKVGRVSGGCRSTLQAGGALSLFILCLPPLFFFLFWWGRELTTY